MLYNILSIIVEAVIKVNILYFLYYELLIYLWSYSITDSIIETITIKHVPKSIIYIFLK
jgi:hypothetical protein